MVERIQSGITGFDSLVEGGFPKGDIILISGTPGTGKSIFCSQILYYNAAKGKSCLYLNLEQNEGRLETQMQQFGWDAKKLKNLEVANVDSSSPDMIDFVIGKIKEKNYDLIALDSLDSVSGAPLEPEEIAKMGLEKISKTVMPVALDSQTIERLKLKKIFGAIAKAKVTAFVTSEKVDNAPGISRDTISEFLCDGIVLLKLIAVGEQVNRTIEVEKMRQTKIDGSIHNFEFKQKGIIVQ